MRDWLKKLREEKKYSQKDLSTKLGYKQSCYAMIERGERQKDLDLSLVSKLSEILNVSIEYIVEQEKALNLK